MATLYPVLGGAVAVAGGDKLFGRRSSYRSLFRHLRWSESEMQSAAAAELVGGLMMIPRFTRRLGGALVAGTSAVILASEVERGDTRLAGYRGLVLLAGLAAALSPGDE